MTQTLENALASLKVFTDEVDYALVKLPSKAITAAAGVIAEISEPFCALLVDKDEVSLIIPWEALDDFITRLPGHTVAEKRYRLITLDVALDLSLTGFMAAVSQSLAAAGVPVLAYAAYTRDHVLVPADQVDNAIQALQKLQSRG